MATKADIIQTAKAYGVPRQKAPGGFSVSQMCAKYLELVQRLQREVMSRNPVNAASIAQSLVRQAEYIENQGLSAISNQIDTYVSKYEPFAGKPYLSEYQQKIGTLLAQARQAANRLQSSGR